MTQRPRDVSHVDALRQQLLAERRKLLAQVTQIESDLEWLDTSIESESEEEGQELNIARLLERLDERDRATIGAIDRALERMRAGTYDRCTACHEEIPLPRLQAVPTTELCRPCAEMREALERP